MLSLQVSNLIAISPDCSRTGRALGEFHQGGSSAEPELIILEDVQGDHTTTLQLNNTQQGKSRILKLNYESDFLPGSYQPEKLEDLYQDITKNVLKKIVKIRNLKNAIV